MRKLLALGSVLALASAASANIRITEFMYSGTGPEFIELTNIGSTPQSIGSFDDSTNIAGSFDLSSFGNIAPGESVIITEGTAAQFIADWHLSGVKVLGDNTQNLGRSDSINIYDDFNFSADQLNYGDQTFPGTIRTQGASGWAIVNGDGPFGDITNAWKLSAVGDSQGSSASANGDIGSPGRYVVPEPATLGLVGGLVCVALRRRR